MSTIQVYVYQWFNDGGSEIRGYGVCPQMGSLHTCLAVKGFQPAFYAEGAGVACRLARKKKTVTLRHLYAQHGARPKKFTRLEFANRFDLRNAREELEAAGVPCHETDVSTVLQFTCGGSLPSVGWIQARPREAGREPITDCDLETEAVDLRALDRADPCPPLTVTALDLEVYSEGEDSMPSDRPGDAVFQAALVTRYPDGRLERLLLAVAGRDYADDVLQYKDEPRLIEGFCRAVERIKPHLLVGYNVLGFDMDYLLKRAARYGLADRVRGLGRRGDKPARQRRVAWASSAYARQEYVYPEYEGVLVMDLLAVVRRDYKLSNYRLETVAQEFLGEGKDPVDYKDIFRAYRTGVADRVGRYCVKDAELCLRLMDRLEAWTGLTEMAAVCQTDVATLYTQGQQIKIFSQIYRHCRRQSPRIVVTDPKTYRRCAERGRDPHLPPPAAETDDDESYVGAYVVEPEPGMYRNVVPLDFSSLYPSIMIAKNICYSTFAEPDDPDAEVFEWEDHVNCAHSPKALAHAAACAAVEDLEDRLRRSPACAETAAALKEARRRRAEAKPPAGRVVCAKRSYAFLTAGPAGERQGVVPRIARDLLLNRQKAKAAMKKAREAGQADLALVYDKRQLAYKVSANSMYGAMGVRRGYLPFPPGAMCVTYYGRMCIEKASSLVKELYGGSLVYGDTDSNYVQFPGELSAARLWDLATEAAAVISSNFPPPVKLEFEQVIYTRFLILSKKRYMYTACDRDGRWDGKTGCRGVLLARRDNAQVVRRMYACVAEALLRDPDPRAAAAKAVEEAAHLIFAGDLPAQEFSLVKQVGDWTSCADGAGDYAVKDLEGLRRQAAAEAGADADPQAVRALLMDKVALQLPPHVRLAERMRLRGMPVGQGSRLEYVVLRDPGGKRADLKDRLESLEYFCRHRAHLPLDRLYYLKAAVNPVDQLLEVGGGPPGLVSSVYEAYRAKDASLREMAFLRASRY